MEQPGGEGRGQRFPGFLGQHPRRHGHGDRMPPQNLHVRAVPRARRQQRRRREHREDNFVDFLEAQARHRLEHFLRGLFRADERAVAALEHLHGEGGIMADQSHDLVNVRVRVLEQFEQLDQQPG
jgi:hypothetical protein